MVSLVAPTGTSALVSGRSIQGQLRVQASSAVAARSSSGPWRVVATPKLPRTASAKRDPLRAFPWDVAAARLGARLGDLAWTSLKWLSVPTLLVSSGSELLYALVHGKALLVPLAMLLGIAVAGIMKETGCELQQQVGSGGAFPWHLIAVGALFGLVKLPGPSYPGWARVFLPHFANGGLWQACYLIWRYRTK